MSDHVRSAAVAACKIANQMLICIESRIESPDERRVAELDRYGARKFRHTLSPFQTVSKQAVSTY